MPDDVFDDATALIGNSKLNVTAQPSLIGYDCFASPMEGGSKPLLMQLMEQRPPGPLCGSQPGASWIDEGTMCRSRSAPPGPVGVDTRIKVRIRFTRRADESGWLAILLSRTNGRAALCEYTEVEITGERYGRLFFTVADGNSDYVGQEASLTQEAADKYLANDGPAGPATVVVRYLGAPSGEDSRFKGHLNQQWADLLFNGRSARATLNSVWDGRYTPIPAGAHMIMAPDTSHGNISTAGYRQATPGLRCTDVWFPIQLSGTDGNSGRYIHMGHLSEGCVTVHELTKWNGLYDYLIRSRVPRSHGKFVGNLVVQTS